MLTEKQVSNLDYIYNMLATVAPEDYDHGKCDGNNTPSCAIGHMHHRNEITEGGSSDYLFGDGSFTAIWSGTAFGSINGCDQNGNPVTIEMVRNRITKFKADNTKSA